MISKEAPNEWRLGGSEEPDILVVGHSHILALLAGYSQRADQPQIAQFGFMYSDDRARWPQVDDRYWESALSAAASTVAIVWNGNQHNAHFMLQTEPPLRLAGAGLLDDVCNDSPNSIVVSQTMFEELWQSDFSSLKEVLERLSRVKRCLVVGTPPPKDEDEIREHLIVDEYFLQRAGEMGIEVGSLKVTPNEFRVGLWRQIQEGLANVADQTGAEFVPVAPSCMTSSSLLVKGFGAPDATHANGLYGAEMLRALEQKWMEPS